jgi:hypothetical protein
MASTGVDVIPEADGLTRNSVRPSGVRAGTSIVSATWLHAM